jgi:hypothetical protein
MAADITAYNAALPVNGGSVQQAQQVATQIHNSVPGNTAPAPNFQVGGWYPVGPGGQSQQYTGSGFTSTPMGSGGNTSSLTNQMSNAASQISQAQIDAAVAQYNQMRANLEAQRPQLQSAYDTAMQGLQGGIQQNQAQADAQTNMLNTQSQNAINTANQNYLQLQAQNRGLARAYGGYGSDFEEMQNSAGRNFGQTVGGIQSDTANRVNEIQQNLAGYLQQASAQKAQLGNQLQAGMKQIALDEYATDQQKASAIGQIQADYAGKIANINQSILQFQQQFALAQQQAASYAALYGKSAANFAPTQQAQALLNTPAVQIGGGAQQLTGVASSNDKTQGGFFPTVTG